LRGRGLIWRNAARRLHAENALDKLTGTTLNK
jgi:hypothetical protein